MKTRILILILTIAVSAAQGAVAGGLSLSGGPQFGFISNEGGPTGGMGFTAEVGLDFSDGFGLFLGGGAQDLGAVEFTTAAVLLDGYGIGTFVGLQENDYSVSYFSLGMRIGNTGNESGAWGNFGVSKYTFKTEATLQDGYFTYADIYGYYQEAYISGLRDEESIGVWGFSIGGGARKQLGKTGFMFLHADTHFIPIGNKSNYTRSEDGTVTMLAMQLGFGVSL